MSTGLSVGSAAAPAGTDTAFRPRPVTGKQNAMQVSTDDPALNIQNTRELIRARIQGHKVTIADQQLIREIERAVKAVTGPITEFDISIHKPSNELLIKVLDKDTGELIREIPPEQTLNIVAHLKRMAGIIVDERR